ncbi:MAG: hypothetical protein ACYTCU_02645 [Planctomycetota bacterium]|jgi:hypothetical protein
MIPFRTGNLGVARLLALRKGEPLPDPAIERAELTRWRSLGFDAVEDYVAWEVVEQEPGRFDWSFHRGNARAAARAGLAYVIYPWAHAVPRWYRATDEFVPGRCLEHNRRGTLPSLFAQSTWESVHRFYRAVRDGLGDVAAGVVAAFPADYGEAGFPSGVADWLLVDDPARDHHHTGLWCGEREARLLFTRLAREHYRTPARLGAAWALSPDTAWEHCPYPGPYATPEHRLAFAGFYRGALTRMFSKMLEEVQRLFPRLQREMKLGHCSEALELGTDWNALVRAAAHTDTLVRFTGAGMGEIFTKRLASLCRTHGARLATEAPREVDERHLAERVFTDAANGSTAFFEFPEQLEAVAERIERVRPALGMRAPRPAIACAYPTQDLCLENGRGVPDELFHCHGALRRVCDFDLYDEQQIASGALRDVSGLIVLDGARLPHATLSALHRWVAGGGLMFVGTARAPQAFGDAPLTSGAMRDVNALCRAIAPLARDDPALARVELGRRPDAIWVLPGDSGARLFLGAGWHGREDGAWAWPAGERSVPCRWTDARAELSLPRPAGPDLDLVVDAFVPPGAPDEDVVLSVDGVAVGSFAFRGAHTCRARLPAAGADGPARSADGVARVLIETKTHQPHEHAGGGDRRELGLLVRRVALVPAGEEPETASAGCTLDTLRVAAASRQSGARPIGKGLVLAGDGTPLSAMAWLLTWLAGELQGHPSPDPPRDASQSCLVTPLADGLLLHNPDASLVATPTLVGRGADARRAAHPPGIELQPLQTLWLD